MSQKSFIKKHLSWNKSATFLVDAQQGFTPLCRNELPVPEGDLIVAECIATFERTKFKVASKDAHPSNASWLAKDKNNIGTPTITFLSPQMDLYWPKHCVVGTPGFNLIPGLPPIEDFDFIIYKGVERYIHPYSAVYHLLTPNSKSNRISTGVIEFFKAKGITTVVIVGLATNYCCAGTAIDLVKAEFHVIMNLGGCRGIGDTNPAIDNMKYHGVEFVYSAAELK